MELPTFTHTNENLRAIIAGMEPTESDSILAIAGSGDQAFALLEYAGNVIAVDIDKYQINFMKQRVNALKKGDYRNFLKSPVNHKKDYLERISRNRYFRTNGRMERIRERMGRLEIVEGDIFQTITRQRGEFNKLYLSNVESLETLHMSEFLPDNCLIYFSSPSSPVERICLVADKRFTSRTRRFNNYFFLPTVYRKVGLPLEVSPVAPLRAPVAYAP